MLPLSSISNTLPILQPNFQIVYCESLKHVHIAVLIYIIFGFTSWQHLRLYFGRLEDSDSWVRTWWCQTSVVRIQAPRHVDRSDAVFGVSGYNLQGNKSTLPLSTDQAWWLNRLHMRIVRSLFESQPSQANVLSNRCLPLPSLALSINRLGLGLVSTISG